MTMPNSAVDTLLGHITARQIRHGGNPLAKRGGGQRNGAKPSMRRMARAGGKDGKAIFKNISKGGARTKGGLVGQMEYIFRDEKCARTFDSRGVLEGHDKVPSKTMRSIARKWEKEWWGDERIAHTSHLILSYPKAATIDQAEAITRAVCNEMFETGDETYDYVVSIHDDQEHHPHAHILLNRHGSKGGLFLLRSGTDHSYEAFRESMAAHGERVGLSLDPTFRFERGITTRQPSQVEQRLAQKENRPPVQRARTGMDLERADASIKAASIVYSAMAVIAQNEDCDRLATLYENAAKMLGNNQEIDMANEYDEEMGRFEKTANLFGEVVMKIEAELKTKSDLDRAGTEKELSDLMREATRLAPDADYARDLHAVPDANTIYSHKTAENAHMLDAPDVQDRLEELVKDYGLDGRVMATRLQLGADNSRLETTWANSDLSRIADRHALNLDVSSNLKEAREMLSDGYDAARTFLVSEKAIEYLPHLDRDHRWLPPKSDTYEYTPDRIAVDASKVLDFYREHGAPEKWISSNRETIENEVSAQYLELQDDYLQSNRPIFDRYVDFVRVTAEKPDTVLELDSRLRESVLQDIQALEVKTQSEDRNDPKAIAEALAAEYPDMPHITVDVMAEEYVKARELLDMPAPERANPEVPLDREAAIDREIAAEVARLRAQGYSRAYISERSHEIEDEATARVDAGSERPAEADVSDRGQDRGGNEANEALLREIEQGVSAQFDGPYDEYTRFENVVSILSDRKPNYLDLAEQLLELAEDRSSGVLDDRDIERLDVLIKETVTNYGDRISRTIANHLNNHERIQSGYTLEQPSVINEMEIESLREVQDRYNKLAEVYEVEITAGKPYALDEEYFERLNDRGHER